MFVLSGRTAGAERERDRSVQDAACPIAEWLYPRWTHGHTHFNHLSPKQTGILKAKQDPPEKGEGVIYYERFGMSNIIAYFYGHSLH